MKFGLWFYADRNFGDDAMIEMLLDELSMHEFYIFSLKDGSMVQNLLEMHQNLHLGSRRDLILRGGVDGILNVGGSIFQMQTLSKGIGVITRGIRDFVFRNYGVDIFVVGSNIGPVVFPFTKILPFILKIPTFMSVRDYYSFELAREVRPLETTAVFPDMIFGYDKIIPSKEIHECLGISTYDSRNPGANKYFSTFIAKISDTYIENTGNRVKLFAFETGVRRNDLACAYHIKQLVRHKNMIDIIPYRGNVVKFSEEFSKCKFVIPVRFHSLVLALKFRRKFLPVVYSLKSTNLLKDIQYSGPVLHYNKLWANNPAQVASIIINEDVPTMKLSKDYFRRAKGHIRELKQYLEDI